MSLNQEARVEGAESVYVGVGVGGVQQLLTFRELTEQQGVARMDPTHILRTANQKVANGRPPVRGVCAPVCLPCTRVPQWPVAWRAHTHTQKHLHGHCHHVKATSLKVIEEEKISSLKRRRVDASGARHGPSEPVRI